MTEALCQPQWLSYGMHTDNDPYFGYCSSTDEAINVLHAFEKATSNEFVVLKKEKSFGTMDITAENHYVMFEGKVSRDSKSTIPFCGQPFLVLSQRVYECKYGVDRHLWQKEQQFQLGKNQAKASSSSITPVKLDCPAKVVMKEVLLFPQYFVKQNAQPLKKKASKKLRDALKSNVELQVEQRIYISLPPPNTHRNHLIVEIEEAEKPLNVLSQKMKNAMMEAIPDPFASPTPLWPSYENAPVDSSRDLDNFNLRIFPTEKEVSNFINDLERETSTSYIVQQKDKHFSDKSWRPNVSYRIYWKHPVSFARTSIKFDGFPFMFVGRKILCCHHGPDQALSKRKKRAEQRKLLNQTPTRNVGSKKLGCKAQIYISHIVKFPDVRIPKDTERRRKVGASKLRDILTEKQDAIDFKTFFLVSVPSTADHEGHLLEVSEIPKKKKCKRVGEWMVGTSQVQEVSSAEDVTKPGQSELEASDCETVDNELQRNEDGAKSSQVIPKNCCQFFWLV